MRARHANAGSMKETFEDNLSQDITDKSVTASASCEAISVSGCGGDCGETFVSHVAKSAPRNDNREVLCHAGDIQPFLLLIQ